jgi:hypothetical protein
VLALLPQLVDICRTQLDKWSAAGGPIDIAAEGKDLSFEFSTQLLVRRRHVHVHVHA